MFTKTITPIIKEKKVVGTKIRYRFLGLLVAKKTLLYPQYYGIGEDLEGCIDLRF
jgi:hypothetical protein